MPARPRDRGNKSSRTPRVLACSNCRTRKTKCDGGQPGCMTCAVYNVACRYDKPPSMSTMQTMSRKLREYEEHIKQLEQQPASLESLPLPTSPSLGSSLQIPTPKGHTEPVLPTEVSGPSEEAPQADDHISSGSLPPDVTLDEHGKLCYHGPTSSLYDRSGIQALERRQCHAHSPRSDYEARTLLATTAVESRAWEDFALDNAVLRTNIPKKVISELLQLHWSWIAPMFMWVYRPAFMRDMSTGGQYCSEFLLTVLCAHSARFRHDRMGDVLIARARLLLGSEIQSPSSISTVQALLQLSARDLAFGSTSQAWLYSGMAFRMVSDLGLHHSSGRSVDPGHASAEEVEIRRRLFWSCYLWDKAISLYLGRMPILRELPASSSPILLDDSAEHELWAPYYGSSGTPGPISSLGYPPMEAHSISCFENSCKLAVIINEIIEQLYSRRELPDTDSAMRRTSEELSAWRNHTPPHLWYDANNLPAICGPPHIVTQNLLYNTTCILLHRPFSTSSVHLAACRAAADSIEALLRHFESTFGFTRITYLMAYCVYLGASVMVQDVRGGDLVAADKIDTFLRALTGSCKTCPGVQRSLDIIQNSLARSTKQTTSTIEPCDEGLYDFLPAFPNRDVYASETDNNLDSIFDTSGFSMLDSFPEEHLDFTNSDWYIAP